MPHINRRLALAALLAGVAMPALAARIGADGPFPATGGPTPEKAASMRLADDDHDEGRNRRRKGEGDGRDRHHDDDDDHDDEDDDEDDGDRGAAAMRPAGPAPAQNPLIGAPSATTN